MRVVDYKTGWTNAFAGRLARAKLNEFMLAQSLTALLDCQGANTAPQCDE
jgi:hypothetical protein